MRRISEKIVRILLCGTLAVMTAFFFQPCSAPAAEKAPEGEEGGLSIEVVEKLSIDDQITIEEDQVPLAAFDRGPAPAGGRHVGMMGLVLLASLGYTFYVDRSEKKLFALRLEAAGARREAMEADILQDLQAETVAGGRNGQ